jgi:hypothetical protein
MTDRPETVRVDGAGLFAWAARTDVHIYRVTCGKRNGHYELFLLWLDGRELRVAEKLPLCECNDVTGCKFASASNGPGRDAVKDPNSLVGSAATDR